MKETNHVNGQVYLSHGMTLNLGNFESARVDVSVSMPVMEQNATAYNRAFDKAVKFVEDKLTERLDAMNPDTQTPRQKTQRRKK